MPLDPPRRTDPAEAGAGLAIPLACSKAASSMLTRILAWSASSVVRAQRSA
jgi:hypothetical protein